MSTAVKVAHIARALSRPSRTTVHRFAWASLAANIGIVITGSAVRLTASGLGCPTWPTCQPGSVVPVGQLGYHEYIEFGNRLLTYAVGLAAALSAWTAWRYRPARRDWRWLSTGVLAGIPAQALIGGISVLMQLNPWVVMVHLLVSLVLIGLASWLVLSSAPSQRREPVLNNPGTHKALSRLGVGLLVVLAVVAYLGSMVTGAGPHAGDAQARRIGLDVALLSQLHADAVFLFVGLSVGMRVLLAVVGAPARTQRAFTAVLVVLTGQAVVGYTQYALHVPALLVGVHVALAALLVAVSVRAVATLWHQPTPALPTPAGAGNDIAAADRPDQQPRVSEYV